MRKHYDQDLERAVLGGIFHRPDVLKRLASLEVEDFYNLKHQLLFTAIRALESRSEPVDPISVESELQRVGKLGPFGGESEALAAIAQIAWSHTSPDNVEHYAKVLVKHRITRDVRAAAAEVIEAIDEPANEDFEGEEAQQWAVARMAKIRVRSEGADLSVWDVVKERLGELERMAEERMTGKTVLTGLPTGIAELDRIMGGYQPGIVTVVAGRPGMGKSAGGLSAADACSASGIGAHVFSLEDTRSAYGDRVIAREAKVSAESLRKSDLNRQQVSDVHGAVTRIRHRQGWRIDDRSGITATEVVRSWRRIGEKNKTRLVVVDYIQRLKKQDQRMSDFDHVSEVMLTLSDAAKADKVSVVAMSQLNREVEKREDKRPLLSDMRGGGTIEELSKAVIAYYRGAYYGPPVKGLDYEQSWECPSDEDWAKRVEIHVLKNSNGATGRVIATFDGPTTRIW